MANRRSRSRGASTLLGVVVARRSSPPSLLAGVVQAAHRDRGVPHDGRRRASPPAASPLMVSSNVTGTELARRHGATPARLGRVLLESRLQAARPAARATRAAGRRALQSPPPDANAAEPRHRHAAPPRRRRRRPSARPSRGCSGLHADQPDRHRRRRAAPSPTRVGVPGAEGLLRYAGEQLVLADHHLPGPARRCSRTVSAGATLPPASGRRRRRAGSCPRRCKADARPMLEPTPRLAATVAPRDRRGADPAPRSSPRPRVPDPADDDVQRRRCRSANSGLRPDAR